MNNRKSDTLRAASRLALLAGLVGLSGILAGCDRTPAGNAAFAEEHLVDQLGSPFTPTLGTDESTQPRSYFKPRQGGGEGGGGGGGGGEGHSH